MLELQSIIQLMLCMAFHMQIMHYTVPHMQLMLCMAFHMQIMHYTVPYMQLMQ